MQLLDEVEHRLFQLTAAIIEADSTAITVALRMLNATLKVSAKQSETNRLILCEAMHNAADRLARPAVGTLEDEQQRWQH